MEDENIMISRRGRRGVVYAIIDFFKEDTWPIWLLILLILLMIIMASPKFPRLE